jgi:uncharacterized membrane protein
MKTFLTKLRDVAIAVFFALFPIYVVFVIFSKAWTLLTSVGVKLSGMFGIKTIFGIHAGTALTGILIIAIWFVSGLLVRISFMNTLSRAMERSLSKFLPGYATYKADCRRKVATQGQDPSLHKRSDQMARILATSVHHRQDQDGNCVVFLPDIPNTKSGSLLLAKHDQLGVVSSLTANQIALP